MSALLAIFIGIGLDIVRGGFVTTVLLYGPTDKLLMESATDRLLQEDGTSFLLLEG